GPGDVPAAGGGPSLEAASEHGGRNRLAEGDRVALEQPAAAWTARRQDREVDGVVPEAFDAIQAADQRRVAVDLEQPPTAGEAVEVVDVLRDQRPQHADVLELDQRVVAGIRPRRTQRFPELAHGTRPLPS